VRLVFSEVGRRGGEGWGEEGEKGLGEEIHCVMLVAVGKPKVGISCDCGLWAVCET